MTDLDPDIHQPTRLRLLAVLSGVKAADFQFLRAALGLTQGNLSSHMSRLEEIGYVEVTKAFEGKLPKTTYRLTDLGRERLAAYWQAIDEVRAAARPAAKPAGNLGLGEVLNG